MEVGESSSRFKERPAETEEDCDTLLLALLDEHIGDGRWKKIQTAFQRLAVPRKSDAWLKNRAKKLSAPEAKPIAVSKHTPHLVKSAADAPEEKLCIGTLVMVHGLPDGDARMLNDMEGVIVGKSEIKQDPSSCFTYRVRLGNAIYDLPPGNLKAVSYFARCSKPNLQKELLKRRQAPSHITHHDLDEFCRTSDTRTLHESLSIAVLEAALKNRGVQGMFCYAHLRDVGVIRPRDPSLAAGLYESLVNMPASAATSVEDSMMLLGLDRSMLPGVNLRWWHVSVEAQARFVLAEMFWCGDGVREDESKGAEWLISAAELGHPQAQKKLASFYFYGDGVQRDKRNYYKWTQRAAESGHPYSQYLLHSFYGSGDAEMYGFKLDLRLAFHWLLKAAEGDEGEAQLTLGTHFVNGTLGCPADEKWAAYWFMRSAACNCPDGIEAAEHMIKDALKFKRKGDSAYDAGSMSEALVLYGIALGKAIGNPYVMKVLLASKSSAHLFLDSSFVGAQMSEDLASFCVRLDPSWAEGYWRMGFALLAKGDFEKAKCQLQKSLRLDPANSLAKQGMECVKRQFSGRLANGMPRCRASVDSSRHATVKPDEAPFHIIKDYLNFADKHQHVADLLRAILPKFRADESHIQRACDDIQAARASRRSRCCSQRNEPSQKDKRIITDLQDEAIRLKQSLNSLGDCVTPDFLEQLGDCESMSRSLSCKSPLWPESDIATLLSLNLHFGAIRVMGLLCEKQFEEAEQESSSTIRQYECKRGALSDEYDTEASSDLLVARAEVYKLRGEARLQLGRREDALADAVAACELAAIDMGILSQLVPQCPPTVSCALCGGMVLKQRVKRHRKKECPQRTVRCECGEDVIAVDLASHRADVCDKAFIDCSGCGKRICRGSLQEHLESRCLKRQVECQNKGCTWSGTSEDHDQCHHEVCPHKVVPCSFCWQTVEQGRMSAHVCQSTRVHGDCYMCREPFNRLIELGSPPSILLVDGLRSCDHGNLVCISCACQWQRREEGKGCPFCREVYTEVAALPLEVIQLTVPARSGGGSSLPVQRPLAPKLDDCWVGSVHWMSPLEIRFTHDQIRGSFRPFRRRSGEQVPETDILATATEVLSGSKHVELDKLEVVTHDESIFVAGTGNRRLCMWRLLSLFYPDEFRLIKVKFVSRSEVFEWEQRLSSKCEGKWVEVRCKGKIKIVGKSLDGDDSGDPGVQWAEARALLGPGDERIERPR